jgi:hypothetical protein
LAVQSARAKGVTAICLNVQNADAQPENDVTWRAAQRGVPPGANKPDDTSSGGKQDVTAAWQKRLRVNQLVGTIAHLLNAPCR